MNKIEERFASFLKHTFGLFSNGYAQIYKLQKGKNNNMETAKQKQKLKN
jgi:hypothetical protein